MALPVVELAVALLGVAVLALALIWIFRFVQYRRAVQLSHARWLPYDADGAAARLLPDGEDARDENGGSGGVGSSTLDWPSLKPFMLSPIPEERFDSGRESETDSAASSVRKDRRSAISIVPYGSF